MSKVQSVLNLDAVCLKNLRYEDLLNNCLVIVMVYAEDTNRVIRKKNSYCKQQVVNSGTQYFNLS